MSDFIVVANRLPVDLLRNSDGSLSATPSPGGLVAALSPVLAAHQGSWVGWPGAVGEDIEAFTTDEGLLLHPVRLEQDDFERFYEGFSNATLWPLYHDLIVPPTYDVSWWESYRDVNERFATEVDKVADHGATVWVQDYQLQLVPGILRQTRPDLTIGFFLHIPFPSADLFRQLPWREEIIRGLLGSDIVGFHLESSAQNFLNLVPNDTGNVSTRSISAHVETSDGRQVGVGAFPISIDPTSLGEANRAGAGKRRKELGNPTTLLLGVDRLDYTKGILQRLLAFESLLESGAIDPTDATFVQIATPSRERIDHYKQTRSEVEEAVGRINGKFGQYGKMPVHYMHRSVSKTELRTYYEAADVMVVTPYKDGMNLVAKEYVAAHPDGTGALVLSEFAGAAVELSEANLCNPFDVESIKKAILNAIRGLEHDEAEMRRRMQTMHQQVITHDVDLWAYSFLGALA